MTPRTPYLLYKAFDRRSTPYFVWPCRYMWYQHLPMGYDGSYPIVIPHPWSHPIDHTCTRNTLWSVDLSPGFVEKTTEKQTEKWSVSVPFILGFCFINPPKPTDISGKKRSTDRVTSQFRLTIPTSGVSDVGTASTWSTKRTLSRRSIRGLRSIHLPPVHRFDSLHKYFIRAETNNHGWFHEWELGQIWISFGGGQLE